MQRKFCFVLLLSVMLSSAVSVYSQDSKFNISTLGLQSRVDYIVLNNPSGYQSGFYGKYLNFCMNAQISDKFSFSIRQRINDGNVGFSTSFFKGTDWAFLSYQANKNFSFSAGKDVIAIGGWEYDYAPIDVYYGSALWNSINCYEIGAKVTFTDDSRNHTIMAQICNSPFTLHAGEKLYAYNLIWYGKMDFFKTIYSLNYVEYESDKYLTFAALGNKFDFGRFWIFVDYMVRYLPSQDFFKNYDLIAELRYMATDNLGIVAKAGQDANSNADPTIAVSDFGIKYRYAGLGADYFALRGKNNVRMHAFVAAALDDNDDLSCTFNIGLTYKLDFIK